MLSIFLRCRVYVTGENSIFRGMLIPLIVLLLVPFITTAQQQGLFTQYMFNMLAINPAYAGYAGAGEALDMRLIARQQWIGIEGAPSTQTLSMHSPIRKKNMGVGLQVSHDAVGVTREVSTDLIYAYHLPLSRRRFTGKRFRKGSALSFGLQAGVSYFRNERSRINTNTRQLGDDPMFAGNDISTALFNIGAGVYYYSEKFYVGLSLPRILENKQSKGGGHAQHIFFSTGILFPLSPALTLKPTMLIKYLAGAPLQLDIATSLFIKELLWVGVSWRSFASINFLVEYDITHRLRLGYAYDAITTGLNVVTNNTHEFMLNYRIPLGEIKVLNPRCF